MKEEMLFLYPPFDFLLNILGFVFFLIDVVLDICTVVDFYQKQEFVSMGVLIFLLLGSSTLLQVFSWLWYSYSTEQERSNLSQAIYLEKYFKNRRVLKALHVCQVGVFLRFIGVMEISLRNLASHSALREGIAVYLTHDLSLLRLIETFTESVPQLALMIAVIAIKGNLEWMTGLKTLGSFVTIAFSVVTYHRSMRNFTQRKSQLTWPSSVVYFLWNLFLIAPRVAVVGLVGSTLPEVMAAHFIGLWIALFVWAWLQKTDFMEDKVWEWLYRATVALIWYFSWFNVSKGRSKGRSVLYHSIMAVDMALLLVLWWWWEGSQDAQIFGVPVMVGFASVAALYCSGILGKLLYYRLCHPRKLSDDEDEEKAPACYVYDEVDLPMPPVQTHLLVVLPKPLPLTAAQKRMQKMAGHFFS
ncbi:XK-related protein 8-like [Engraulis encrasicolus]|uniref:XK-related protein 8-like n=1 Tax=Engraulis encrasicolus TaxID=184585 RepID=UPI002FD6E1C5